MKFKPRGKITRRQHCRIGNIRYAIGRRFNKLHYNLFVKPEDKYNPDDPYRFV